MSFNGPAAVVGGGSGIGRGFALAAAGRGLPVAVGDVDLEAAEQVRDEILGAGGRAVAHRVDGTDAASLEEFAASSEAALGSAALLSANLGISLERPLAEATDDEWRWMLDFNLLSAVRAVRAFLPGLRRAEGARGIVVAGSVAGLFAPVSTSWDGRHRGIYSTTKHALLGYTDMLRAELADEGIGVSLLCPGLVTTNMGITSALHGPGATDDVDLDNVAQPGANGLDPDELGRVTLEAMTAGRFLVPAPYAAWEQVEARYAGFKDDFDYVAGLRS